MFQSKSSSLRLQVAGFLVVLAMVASVQLAEAGQGCPFDDGSCQEYCNQQGCNMGYCGHFAWIQCICRKCGDEWSWYDKVRYNPDKTVNQTELDSLKLNGTTTLILTNGQQQQQQQQPQQQQQQQQQVVAKAANGSRQAEGQKQQTATLTTLLIPDLSDTSGKLDLNDIPDENSDKFLDYLAKNHEKLVRATATNKQPADGDQESDDEEESQIVEIQTSQGSTTVPQVSGGGQEDDETIEIQISSSNNNTSNSGSTITSTTTTVAPAPQSITEQPQVVVSSQSTGAQQHARSPTTRLLRMAVIERASEEID